MRLLQRQCHQCLPCMLRGTAPKAEARFAMPFRNAKAQADKILTLGLLPHLSHLHLNPYSNCLSLPSIKL
jgi:hypothetical protein